MTTRDDAPPGPDAGSAPPASEEVGELLDPPIEEDEEDGPLSPRENGVSAAPAEDAPDDHDAPDPRDETPRDRVHASSDEGVPSGQLELLATRQARYGRRVVAFASGKGGVGKSLLCANVGIFLAQIGKRVVLLDGNLGCANLHTLLGAERQSRTLADFIERRVTRLEDVIGETPVAGLGLIAGEQDPVAAASPKPSQKSRLLQQLRDLPADYVLLDLAPGTGHGVLDLFLQADIAVVVAVPEPGSVESAYRLVKCAFMRRLREVPQSERLAAHARREGGIPAPLDLAELGEALDPALGERLRREVQSFVPRLVVNQTRTRDDVDLGPAMRSAARRRLGITFDVLGSLEFDEAARVAVRRCRPVAVEYPDAKVTKSLERLTRRLLALESSDSLRHAIPPPAKRWDRLTHFEILEIDPGASDEEVRRAHRRAREVYAPDSMVVRGLFAREELDALARRIEEAYDTLIAPDRRRRYEMEIFPGGRPSRRTVTPVPGLPPPPMPEVAPPPPPDPILPEVGPDTAFTGELLRRIREAKRIDLVDISQKTKIGVPHLRNIEEERFRELPALVYVRGFLTEYARYLKLDTRQVVRTYLERYHAALGNREE